MATPNRNSSPTYRWATPFTRLRKENSFGKFVKILDAMNGGFPAEALEMTVLKGVSYFKEQELFEFIKEYEEYLATAFYKENNHIKASHYFYSCSQAGKKVIEKEALK